MLRFGRTSLVRSAPGALALLLLVPGASRGQEADGSAAAHLPADSMAIGATYVEWMLDYRADSLWTRFSDEMRENFGSVGEFKDRMAGLFGQIGDQRRVISQRYWMRNGKPQFWHTAEFSAVDEPVVVRFVIEPDGVISGIGFNPQSQNPTVDDPNQHGTEADAAGG